MRMLDKIPNEQDMANLLGQPLYDVWRELCRLIDEKYEVEHLWNKGFKEWNYEYKYRRGGKTLCTLYAKKNCFMFLVVLGKKERERFELNRNDYTEEVKKIYDETQTYHDGKWLWFELVDKSLFCDMLMLLFLKRRPNRK